MRLDKLHIKAFGKWTDLTLDFADGFNLIYGDNESGKTTVMAFLKMMFYGSGKTTASIAKSPRKRYLPLKSDDFGGYVEFTHQDVSYRLERDFKKSDSADRVSLFNLNTGERINVPSDNEVGARFFGLSSGAFEQSVYVGAAINCTGDTASAGEIGGKLANLVSSSDEEVSFEAVASRLASARQAYMSKSGNIGIYDKLKARLTKLSDDIIEARRRDADKVQLGIRANSLKNMLKNLEDQQKQIIEELELYSRFEKAKSLGRVVSVAEKTEEKTKELAALKAAITAGDVVADDSFNESISSQLYALDTTREKLESTSFEPSAEAREKIEKIHSEQKPQKEKAKSLADDRENQQNILAAAEETLSKVKKKPILALIILGALVACSAVAVYFAMISVVIAAIAVATGGALAAVGVALIIVGFAVRVAPKAMKQALKNKAAAEERLAVIEKEEAICNEQLALDDKRIESILAVERAQFDNLSSAAEDQTEKLYKALEPFGAERSYESICETAARLKQASADAARLKIELENLKAADAGEDAEAAKAELNALGEIPSDDDPRLSGITDKRLTLNRLGVKITEYKANLSSVQTEIRTSFIGKKTAAQLENEQAAIMKQMSEQEDYCTALSVAYAVLREAFEELMGSFGPQLNRRTAEILESLTCGKYKGTIVSKDLSLTAEDAKTGSMIDWQYLSSGTVDQAYLALRLAVAEQIGSVSGGLPVMLDDPFVQYDDKRAAKGIEFLSEYSKERQVIMFTCRGSFADSAKTHGAKITEL